MILSVSETAFQKLIPFILKYFLSLTFVDNIFQQIIIWHKRKKFNILGKKKYLQTSN